MFIRHKISKSTGSTAIQVVENIRDGNKTRQRVIRHVGTALTPEKLEQLKQVALAIKTELEHEALKQQVISPSTQSARNLGKTKQLTKPVMVDLNAFEEEARHILGFHDIYGYIYDLIGFSNLFSRPSQREASAKILRDIVLARIANPVSKRASISMLSELFGKDLKLEHVYQMMDKIDDAFCERIQRAALASTLKLTGERLNLLFYDVTTLYFESFTENELMQNGYSKDMKFNQPQVMLALFVTEQGLPVGYELFPGATFEGHTLIPVLQKIKARYQLNEITVVADRGMLSKENIKHLQDNKFYYIVGARLRSINKKKQKEILSWVQETITTDTKEVWIRFNNESNNQCTIVSYRQDRAKKDCFDREKSVKKLYAKLNKSKNPKSLLSNYGYQKFLHVDGEAALAIDENKIQAEAIWDGVSGIYSNHPSLSDEKILEQYRSLWKIEDAFRVNKNDLRIRPIYHWSPERITAHIAIAFMAFTCVRYLEYRLRVQSQKQSPEAIRKALTHVQAGIFKDTLTATRYLIPSKLSPQAKEIYRVLKIKVPKLAILT